MTITQWWWCTFVCLRLYHILCAFFQPYRGIGGILVPWQGKGFFRWRRTMNHHGGHYESESNCAVSVFCLIHSWKEHHDLVFCILSVWSNNACWLQVFLVKLSTSYFCRWLMGSLPIIGWWIVYFSSSSLLQQNLFGFRLIFIWFSYWNAFEEILSTFRIVLEWRAIWELTLMKPFVLLLLVMIASEHAHWNTSKMHKHPHLMPTGLHKQ
jgi:hypothetical protein